MYPFESLAQTLVLSIVIAVEVYWRYSIGPGVRRMRHSHTAGACYCWPEYDSLENTWGHWNIHTVTPNGPLIDMRIQRIPTGLYCTSISRNDPDKIFIKVLGIFLFTCRATLKSLNPNHIHDGLIILTNTSQSVHPGTRSCSVRPPELFCLTSRVLGCSSTSRGIWGR